MATASTEEGRAEVVSRLWMVRDSIPMIAKRPLLGYGLGSFVEVFPLFRKFYTNYTVNAAHNDYVQVLVETGTVGFGLILIFIFLLYKEGTRNLIDWQDDYDGSLVLAALVGCSGVLIHSLCDFNLQVPANAAFFFVLAGIVAGRKAPNGSFMRKRGTTVSQGARWWHRAYSVEI